MVNHGVTKANSLYSLMNGLVKQTLQIPQHVTWSGQSDYTFSTLSGDFMKPCTEMGENLLSQMRSKLFMMHDLI